MTRDEASSIIQKQFRNNKQKIETLKITTDILNDIIDNSFNKKLLMVNLNLKEVGVQVKLLNNYKSLFFILF